MSIIFFSDLHGEVANLELFLQQPDVANAQWLIHCGDFFQDYHPLSPQEALHLANLLNDHPAQKLSVRGNNDTLKQLDLFTFPTAQKSITEVIDSYSITLTHGHWGSAQSFAPQSKSRNLWQIFVEGHTHVARLYRDNKEIHLNPGSLSYPRSQLPPTYATLKNKTLTIKALHDGRVYFSEILS
ncbi:YfcE family phosphodiesterase [Entomospira culicis]|uniref:Phosphoesterase n=1 Tax=Entomospira culicis TaxID=2719989 RepID=A0A968GGF8_9SPIO|nr:YfcE family phosphodiesterase [Entomospira culicis]NIZ19482.1 YfcE family phosphodiesterase [Entomospira culicis]NIZ69613.1 YfcE family phosphodiesterase [Entomospira culicis]WDI36724.1 YfcE family phosphodiesterase [Entomospira culicis]WDI38353.1 YfcE family phosphodiesterase [Entomospira culicis]